MLGQGEVCRPGLSPADHLGVGVGVLPASWAPLAQSGSGLTVPRLGPFLCQLPRAGLA